MRAITIGAAWLMLAAATTSARAQAMTIAGAALFDTQRFTEAETPNRLDGSSAGWMALASVQPLRHLVVDAEFTDSTITDERSMSLDIEGRGVTIHSTLAHRTRAGGVLAGFAHRLGARTRLAYLVGASWTEIERRFTTNAPGLVLVPPSDPAASRTSTSTEHFTALAGGVEALMRVSRHLCLLAGARVQALPLDPDLSGHRLALLAGGGWVF